MKVSYIFTKERSYGSTGNKYNRVVSLTKLPGPTLPSSQRHLFQEILNNNAKSQAYNKRNIV